MCKRVLCVVILTIASIASAFSQTRTLEHEYGEFEKLDVSGGFHVNLVQDRSYSTRLVVDDILEPYVECYVKSKTLYITLDEKAIPKDIKKSYKGKNSADPVLKVTVYVPGLNSIKLSSNSTLASEFAMESDSFELTMGDNSVLNNLEVQAKGTVKIESAKKANIGSVTVKAKKFEIVASGNSVVTGQIDVDRLSLSSSGSAEVSLTGKVKEAEIESLNSSKTLLTGSGSVLNISGKGSSAEVDASGFAVESSAIDVAGVTAKVAASGNLELNLDKNSEVTYSGNPKIGIVKILNSSVLRK